MLNLVVIHGVLARPASHIELPSGSRLVSLEMTVRRPDCPTDTVPVSWADPPAWADLLDTGSEVVVMGRVRRRFFRAGGATQSRTEVVAAKVVRASSRSKVATLLSEAALVMEESTV